MEIEVNKAVAIPLEVWQATSEYAIITQYDDSVTICFQYWKSKTGDTLIWERERMGCLRFHRVWTMPLYPL